MHTDPHMQSCTWACAHTPACPALDLRVTPEAAWGQMPDPSLRPGILATPNHEGNSPRVTQKLGSWGQLTLPGGPGLGRAQGLSEPLPPPLIRSSLQDHSGMGVSSQAGQSFACWDVPIGAGRGAPTRLEWGRITC